MTLLQVTGVVLVLILGVIPMLILLFMGLLAVVERAHEEGNKKETRNGLIAAALWIGLLVLGMLLALP